MNKLISRNPILRFKLGRKIIKAKNSWGRDFGRIDLGISTPTIDYQIPSVEIPREQIESLPSVPVARVSYPYRGPIVRLGIQENPNISPSISLDSYLTLGSTKGGLLKGVDEALVQKMANEYLQRLAANETLKSEVKPKLTTTNKTHTSRQLNAPKFYGLTIGGKVLARGSNFNGLINDSLRQALLNAGFKNEDFADVRSFLNALNNFFLKDGVGSIKADNMWGDLTKKAFELALYKAGYDPSNKMALTPTTISNIYALNRLAGLQSAGLLKKPENPTIVPEGGISNFTPLSTAKTYNKADVRDFIRSKGRRAYDFSGSQRKALRMVLNGQGTDEDKAIVKDMGLFKQGGQLPSRNIVKRFKNRKFN